MRMRDDPKTGARGAPRHPSDVESSEERNITYRLTMHSGPVENRSLKLVFLFSAALMFVFALGLCILLVSKMNEAGSFADLLRANRLTQLALVILCLLGFILAVQATDLVSRFAAIPAALITHWRAVALGLIALGFVGSLLMVWVLRAFPGSADEYAFLFEADTFLAGRLWNPLPPLHEFFKFLHILDIDGKWAAVYPPGWPLLLAGAKLFELPSWLVCPLSGIVLLYTVFKLGQRQDGALGGILAVSFVALSPFFLFNAGSYFTEVPAAGAGALFCWMAADFLDQPRFSKGFLAGVALGMLGLIRMFDPLLFGLPFLVAFVWRARRPHYALAPSVILGGLPFLAALLLFNDLVTGSPLLKISGEGQEAPLLRFGLFPVDEHGHPRTPLDQLGLAGVRVTDLANWTSPLLLLTYIPAFAWKVARRDVSFFDFIFPTTLAAFLFIPFEGGNQYGPRYYFEAYPFFILTIVSALAPLLRNKARPRWAAFAACLVLAHGIWSAAATAFLGRLIRERLNERLDLYHQVRVQGLHNAVVIVHSGTGRSPPLSPMDLTRNGLAIEGDVIYALDIPSRLNELKDLFPYRRFYIYLRAPSKVTGILRPL